MSWLYPVLGKGETGRGQSSEAACHEQGQHIEDRGAGRGSRHSSP